MQGAVDDAVEMRAHERPLDATHTLSYSYTEADVYLGATAEPPTLWLETTTYDDKAAATDRSRVTASIVDDEVVLHEETWLQDRDTDAKVWRSSGEPILLDGLDLAHHNRHLRLAVGTLMLSDRPHRPRR